MPSSEKANGKRGRLGKGLEHFFDHPNEGTLYAKAVEFDDSGNYLYAFHYYMRTYELNGSFKLKAANNAAVILAEHGFADEAISLLRDALRSTQRPELLEGYAEIVENMEALESSRGESGGGEV